MKTKWPEYEIINEDESELDIEISEDNRYANSLVSAGSQMDEAMKSLLDNFEVWFPYLHDLEIIL